MMSARFISKIFLVALLVFSAQNMAHAQRRWNPNPGNGFPPGFGQDQQRNRVVLTENVYRDYQGQSQINVQQLFKDPTITFKGMKIESLSMQASSDRGRAKASLEINGFSNSSQFENIPSYSSQIHFQIDQHRNTIGEDIRSLHIKLRGRVYVEKVRIVLTRQDRGQVFEQSLSDFVNFGKTYGVRQTLNIGARHNGKSLQNVQITGSSPNSQAVAQLIIDGRPVGRAQSFHRFHSTLTFRLPYGQSVLGQEIQSIKVQVSGGGAHITGLKAVVAGGRGGFPGDRVPQFVEKTVQLHLTGQQTLSLKNLIQRADLSFAKVKSVEIVGRSRHGNGKVQLCQQFRCRSGLNLGRGMTRHSVYANQNLGQLELKTIGQIHLQKVKVHFM